MYASNDSNDTLLSYESYNKNIFPIALPKKWTTPRAIPIGDVPRSIIAIR